MLDSLYWKIERCISTAEDPVIVYNDNPSKVNP